jgi:hypothetical protein
MLGDKYFVEPASVARHIAQIEELTALDNRAQGLGLSRHVAQLEKEVERLNDDKSFLRQQIQTKDEQIGALLERDRETNILVRGLQQMLSPLLGGPRNDREQRPERQTGFEN